MNQDSNSQHHGHLPIRRPGRGRRPARALRTALVAGTVVALAGGLAACGGKSLEEKGGSQSAGGKGDIVIGSAGFTESKVLAEIYSKIISDAGYHTTVKTLANRELYEPALEKGQIDVVPEYASTLAEFLNAKKNGPKAKPVASSDIDKTVAALKTLAEPRGLKVLPAGEATDQNAFAVTEEFAARHHLKTLSDLGRSKEKVRLAAGEECETRPFCKPGLEKVYGIAVTGIDPKGVGTPQAKQAVKDGTDQMVLTTTTDATLDNFGLVLLKDDKKLQNADNVLPVVNAKSAGDKEIEAALGKLTDKLTTADLIELNRKVDAERQKPEDVARAYLESKGLAKK
ncbi:ABC transporter substrate-binding protein [Streptomyces monomycini]|uniref:ABC transporter substrate-binding protein n=1 Tax=Streptomyces monomycini TaxID=371720 RepID=UPI00067C11B2|nr:ABC transporter substrate-binding protein [Streptomyces monomycini]